MCFIYCIKASFCVHFCVSFCLISLRYLYTLMSLCGFCLSLAMWQGKESLHRKRTEISHLDGQEKMGIDAGLSSGILESMMIF